jgi:hypothetical protein
MEDEISAWQADACSGDVLTPLDGDGGPATPGARRAQANGQSAYLRLTVEVAVSGSVVAGTSRGAD